MSHNIKNTVPSKKQEKQQKSEIFCVSIGFQGSWSFLLSSKNKPLIIDFLRKSAEIKCVQSKLLELLDKQAITVPEMPVDQLLTFCNIQSFSFTIKKASNTQLETLLYLHETDFPTQEFLDLDAVQSFHQCNLLVTISDDTDNHVIEDSPLEELFTLEAFEFSLPDIEVIPTVDLRIQTNEQFLTNLLQTKGLNITVTKVNKSEFETIKTFIAQASTSTIEMYLNLQKQLNNIAY